MNQTVKPWPIQTYRNEASESKQRASTPPLGSVTIGKIAGITADGAPLVSWESRQDTPPLQALSQIPLTTEEIGRRCTLLFEGGDPQRPVILGLLYDHQANRQGYQIIQADDALILQCGASRIEMFEDGRIMVQGIQIDNQAYGPYRIKGASVKVN
jgi:hypothetical protein